MQERRRVAVTVTVFGLAAATLVLGAVDTFVWLPQYLAPTTPLNRIYAALAASGDLPYVTFGGVAWLLFWAFFAALYLALLLPLLPTMRSAVASVRSLSVLALGAIVVGGTAFCHWFSAFGMGMSVSDELPPGVGGTTPLGVALVFGGFAVGAVGVVAGIVVVVTSPKAVPTGA